jgi:hypothetical protein
MEYMEYSLLLNIINKETEDKNSQNDIFGSVNSPEPPPRINLPDHLKVK